MEYNIEKINEIGKMLAEVVGEAMTQTEEEQVRIGDVEMALRETLKAVGQSGLKQFLENADSELAAEIECCAGYFAHPSDVLSFTQDFRSGNHPFTPNGDHLKDILANTPITSSKIQCDLIS